VPHARAVEIPYRGGDYAMLGLVPWIGLAEFEAGLTPEKLASYVAALAPEYVDLRFPPFEFDARLDAVPVLRSLGVVDAFDEERADFSRALDPSLARGWIESVEQLARVRVDEEGTVAAAVTTVTIAGFMAQSVDSSTPLLVRVDRPFLFAIRHRPTGMLLFLGRVDDPRL
jgi:serpin B